MPKVADAGAGFNPAFPVTGINSTSLTVTGVEPATGPFSGGTTAVVRGSGFSDGVVVRVGGAAVQPANIKRDGKSRITIVIPAGMVGPADVTVTQGDASATLPDAFAYNALAVSPMQGSIAGGSLVDLSVAGATLTDDTVVEFDGQLCSELHLTSPQRATCKTPPHTKGIVDITARRPDNSAPMLVAAESYQYVETLDATGGGLSGGPIAGTLNVTIVDDTGGNVIPGALVLVGNDPRTALRGTTDARGTVTFSRADLKGPVTVHATAKCFQRASIVSFDAQNLTLFLSPVLDLTCQADGMPSPGAHQLVANISGQLIFPGIREFEINSWDIVPQPRPGEARVAYIFTTQSSLEARNPPPSASGSELARLVEDTALTGERGYLYRIVARPGGLAVYALCGIERLDTRSFTPYVMGIAHNVITSPGDETRNVDLVMNITLDRELDVTLSGYPEPTEGGPTEFRVRAYTDLGGEGLMVRDVNGVSLDVIRRHSGSEPFRFLGQPAFVGGLKDASYYVIGGYYTPEDGGPFTSQKRTGVRQAQPGLQFTDFLGIPLATAPTNGGLIPADRVLRFKLDGAAAPDLITVDISGGDGQPAWSLILPGDAREVPVPDLSLIAGQSDIAPGFIRWSVAAAKIDRFRYNEFRYTYLSGRYWTHTAVNEFFARR